MKVTVGFDNSEILPQIKDYTTDDPSLYVSEFCKDSYAFFNASETHVVDCATGNGKSYMIVNEIIPRAYQRGLNILLLSNRTKLNDQYLNAINTLTVSGKVPFSPLTHSSVSDYCKCLTIMTYRELELGLSSDLNKTLKSLSNIDIVVADEIHYFLQDSVFNSFTCLSAEFVLMYCARKTRYLLSATMDNIYPVILNPSRWITPLFTDEAAYFAPVTTIDITSPFNSAFIVKHYVMKPDYSYLNVHYFHNFESILDCIVSTITHKEKWIIFVSDKSTGEHFTQLINTHCNTISNKQTAIFVSSDYRSPDELEMQDQMDAITCTEDTTVSVLVTTSVLDNGINLKSNSLLHIVIFADNKISFLQMLGRKRRTRNEDFPINLYISPGESLNFSARKNNVEKIIQTANEAFEYTFDAFCSLNYFYQNHISKRLKAFPFPFTTIDSNNRLLTEFRRNLLSMKQLNYLQNEYADNLKQLSDDSNFFLKKQLSWICHNQDDNNWLPDTKKEYDKKQLLKILDPYIGVELNKDTWCEISKLISSIVKTYANKARSNRVSVVHLNEVFETLKIDLIADSKKISAN